MTKIAPKIIFSCLIFFCGVAWAGEIPVDVKADKLRYVEGTGLVEASGSVEVRVKEITILSDFLLMDSSTNILTAEGRVRIITKDYQAISDSLTYDSEKEFSTFKQFKTRLSPSKIKGNLFVTTREISDQKSKMVGKGGEVTTCDYATPHFFSTADKFEYYPNDKLVGYNVTLYVGEAPVLWMPYLIYDLTQQHKKNWVIGHNDVEGDYVKSSWDYPGGILYLDLMSIKGFGYGTERNYGLMGLGLGTLYLYHIDERDTGASDWVTHIQHTTQINPKTTLKLDHSYNSIYLVPYGRNEQTNFGLNLDYSDQARWNMKLNSWEDRVGALEKYAFSFDQAYQKVSSNLFFNYDFSKADPKWLQTSSGVALNFPLWSDRVTFSGKTNYSNYVTGTDAPGDQRLEPQFEIAGEETAFSWRYRSNWFINLNDGQGNHEYLEKMPEIELTPRPLNLRLFNLQSLFRYGYYHEVASVPLSGQPNYYRSYGTQRYQSSLNATQTLALVLGTTANLGMGLDQFLYGPGDELYAYRESLSLNTDLASRFRNVVSYRKGLSNGNTPFLFDQLGTRYHDVTEAMTFYYQDKFNWTTNGGFNWQTEKWFEVMTSLTLNPTRRISWNVNTGWDIENTRYKDLVNTLTLSPYEFINTSLSSVSDLNDGELMSATLLYDFYILQGQPNQMEVKFDQVYEPASMQFKVRDIMVIKDLHCWELRYTYSDYRKEFSFTFGLKAIPEEPVGFATGRGFYSETFEKAKSEVQQEYIQNVTR